MTRYRYDVVLSVGGRDPAEPHDVLEQRAGDRPESELLAQFAEQESPAVRILDVPNLRLARDLAAARAIKAADAKRFVKDIAETIRQCDVVGIDPEQFYELDQQRYDVRVGWAAGSPEGRFDVALAARQRSVAAVLQRAQPEGASEDIAALAPHPLKSACMQRLAFELDDWLRQQLTEVQPATVIVVDKVPA